MTIKGSLQVSIPIVKAFLTRNFVPSKIGKKIAFWGKIGSKCKILFSGPPRQGTFLRETTSFDVLLVKIGAGVLKGYRRKEEPKKLAESLDAHFRIFGGEGG